MLTRILKIIPDTTVDGEGLRTSVYFAGCKHNCKGCHNPSSWNFDAGEEVDTSYIVDKVIEYDNHKVTFSGGDPMYRKNEVLEIIDELRLYVPDINIWIYTGFTYEELVKMDDPTINEILSKIDVLVDGPFIESLKDEDLLFRGSSNQRIIHFKNGSAVI